MNAEDLRPFLLSLPHVVETLQWGNNLVFWVGDKAIGGKMFALVDLEGGQPLKAGKRAALISFATTPARFAELVEQEQFFPAPYLVRAHWIAAEDWGALRDREWKEELTAAHGRILAKLNPKTLRALALPAREQKRLIAEQRKIAKP